MKLLIVFLSALVLVAQGNVAPSDEAESVYTIEPEVVSGYAVVDAGQEAGDVGPLGVGVFAEEAPAVRVFGAEEEARIGSPQETQAAYAEERAAELVSNPETGVYIPIVSRVCTNVACANVCHRLGFRYGVCISLSTCWCYN